MIVLGNIFNLGFITWFSVHTFVYLFPDRVEEASNRLIMFLFCQAIYQVLLHIANKAEK
jgi:hypothetical protein